MSWVEECSPRLVPGQNRDIIMIKTAFSKSKKIEHKEFMTQQLAVPNPVSATK